MKAGQQSKEDTKPWPSSTDENLGSTSQAGDLLPGGCLKPPTMPRLIHQKNTSKLVWVVAILCAILAVAVIITGIVVFAIYMIYQPRMPYIWVEYAHLDRLDYDQSGLLAIEMALTVVAENDNAKAAAAFSDVALALSFHGFKIAKLLSDPFHVAKNTSFTLNYVVPSSPIPLDEGGMEEMYASLKQGRVLFGLEGKARTRWRVGIFLALSFSIDISCPLQFTTSNGTSIALDCSSKTR